MVISPNQSQVQMDLAHRIASSLVFTRRAPGFHGVVVAGTQGADRGRLEDLDCRRG